MQLSELELKCLMLAMDRAATEDEVATSANKFIRLLRKRYESGVELIKDLGGFSGKAAGAVTFSGPMTDPFGPQARQAARDMYSTWQDILRRAQEQAAQYQQDRFKEFFKDVL